MRNHTIIPIAAFGGLALGVAATLALTPSPTPERIPVVQPHSSACEETLTEWGAGILAYGDMVATLWETGATYSPDIRTRNLDAYSYRYAALMIDCQDLPACETEDSDNCYWNTDIQGNGQGDDFVTLNGQTFSLAGLDN